ncbi:MAG: type II toxin-antitoxin system RelE/ParE family toxin [Segetibacter sp.]|nr:type II toxin-antitoxin system RelE/ParE family toxin [Segetibacter sp.]
MEYQIKIYREARSDIHQIIKWYDLQAEGLGDKFEAMLDNAINSIANNPTAFAYLFENVRRIRVKKFPYIIFYKIDQQNINIFGVIHTKRNPYLIKERFKHLGL